MASDKVSMPLSGAGIIGFSPDIKISGFQIDPKTLIIATVVLVVVVKVATVVTGSY